MQTLENEVRNLVTQLRVGARILRTEAQAHHAATWNGYPYLLGEAERMESLADFLAEQIKRQQVAEIMEALG